MYWTTRWQLTSGHADCVGIGHHRFDKRPNSLKHAFRHAYEANSRGRCRTPGYGGRVSRHMHVPAPWASSRGGGTSRSGRCSAACGRQSGVSTRDHRSPACHQPCDRRQLRGRRHSGAARGGRNGQDRRNYCVLLRMDHEPILRRIHDQLAVLASQSRPANPLPPAPSLGQDDAAHGTSPLLEAQSARARPSPRRRRRRCLRSSPLPSS